MTDQNYFKRNPSFSQEWLLIIWLQQGGIINLVLAWRGVRRTNLDWGWSRGCCFGRPPFALSSVHRVWIHVQHQKLHPLHNTDQKALGEQPVAACHEIQSPLDRPRCAHTTSAQSSVYRAPCVAFLACAVASGVAARSAAPDWLQRCNFYLATLFA